MKVRNVETAMHFGILDKVQELEKKLLNIEHVVSVDFDLDGFWSDIRQVIILPEYDIPVGLPNYYDVRKEMLKEILAVARDLGLNPSGDAIEDCGKHFYIVRDCDASWKKEKTAEMEGPDDGKRALADLIEEAEAKKDGPDEPTPGGARVVNWDGRDDKELLVGPEKPVVLPER